VKKWIIYSMLCSLLIFEFCSNTNFINMINLREGVKSGELSKVEDSISKGASCDRGDFAFAVQKNNIELINIILNSGFSSSDGLVIAAMLDNIKIAKLLIDKGASLVTYENTIDGQVYLVQLKVDLSNPSYNFVTSYLVNDAQIKVFGYSPSRISEQSKPIPIELVRDDGNEGKFRFTKTKKLGVMPKDGYIKYKISKIKMGSSAMIYAIKNRNKDMIHLFLSNGYKTNLPCMIKPVCDVRTIFYFYQHFSADIIRDNSFLNGRYYIFQKFAFTPNGKEGTSINCYASDGYDFTSNIPLIAEVMPPVEYARAINAFDIAELLSNPGNLKEVEIRVIAIKGNIGVINSGSLNGLISGERYLLKRNTNSGVINVGFVSIGKVLSDKSSIRLVDDSSDMKIEENDFIEKDIN
jgi:hypothetical protein